MLILEGLVDSPDYTAYRNDSDELEWFVLPTVPTLRRDGDKAVFKYLRYQTPRPLANGDVGAALVFMDVELGLPAAIEAKLRKQLADSINKRRGPNPPRPVTPDDIRLSRPPVTKAGVSVEILAADGTLVQKVNCANSPSMYGRNIVAVSAQLTQLGAQVFEAAMQSEGAGGVRVVYDLEFVARLPALTATGTWSATKFYSYVQQVNYDARMYAQDTVDEKISEMFGNSESRVIHVDPGSLSSSDPATAKIIDTVTSSIERQLDEAVKRNLLDAIPPESRDVSKLREQGFDDIRRSVLANKRADVSIGYRMAQVVTINRQPQANMPSLTSQGYVWKDYAIDADTNSPFFRQLNLTIQVNAEFQELEIFRVDVSIDYPPHTAGHGIKTFSFSNPDEVGKFTAFTNGGSTKFKYRYVVSYKGESRVLQSAWQEHDSDDLKINIDGLGLWMVDAEVGDIDFNEVNRAVVTLHHPEVQPNVPPLVRFELNAENRTHRIRELLLAPVQPYDVSIKYLMKNGREYLKELPGQRGQQLYVDDPFAGTKLVQVRTRGDFDKQIDNISLDATYEDERNGYRQTFSMALSKDTRFADWSFPVIDERAGKVTYRALTIFKDGSTVDSGLQVLDGTTLMLGSDADLLTVSLSPDLLDWDLLKLVSVELHYSDPENQIDERESFTFKKGTPDMKWELGIRNKRRNAYNYRIRYFFLDSTRKEVSSPEPTTEEGFLIEMPA